VKSYSNNICQSLNTVNLVEELIKSKDNIEPMHIEPEVYIIPLEFSQYLDEKYNGSIDEYIRKELLPPTQTQEAGR
jgi:hypothetical protein